MGRWLLLAAIALLAAWVCLSLGRAFVRQVVFPRPAAPTKPGLDSGIQQVWLGQSPRVEAWLLAPRDRTGPSPAVIFAHGNGELIDYWRDPFATLVDAGVAVMLVEYPGYGRSGGSPSEASITSAMVAAYDWLRDRPGIDAAAITGYGRSLGGGAVCALAASRPLAGLILESSWISLREMAPPFVPSLLLGDRFDNVAAVRAFEGDVLVLHGRNDGIIPFEHGVALARAAGVEPVVMACGHNDCPRPWREVLSFLER